MRFFFLGSSILFSISFSAEMFFSLYTHCFAYLNTYKILRLTFFQHHIKQWQIHSNGSALNIFFFPFSFGLNLMETMQCVVPVLYFSFSIYQNELNDENYFQNEKKSEEITLCILHTSFQIERCSSVEIY